MCCVVNDFLGHETIEKEYKEFCVKDISLYFTNNDIYNLIHKDEQFDEKIFNLMILENIKKYMNKYIPKYASIFSKSNISGSLYLGVNDDGFIQGIPLYGNIHIDYLNKLLINTKKFLRSITNNEKYLDEYFSNINIELVKLENNKIITIKDELENSFYNLNSKIKNNIRLELQWYKYNKEYIRWHTILYKHTSKLITYLQDPELKLNLIEFIIDSFEKDPSLDSHKLSYMIYSINHYEKKDLIINYSDLIKDKYNIFNWIARYKDYITIKIKKLKPKHPMYHPKNNLLLFFSQSIKNIRPFLQKSKKINFYIIKINFPKLDNEYLEYFFNNKWISKKRILISSGPSCI